MHKRGIKQWVVPGAILASTLVKSGIGLGSYSGQGTPPMFGDYEAQRHWMELTIHLPLRQWYTYDLPYWGLDYPPLTAYVSWLCGIIGAWIEPSWFALGTSRGIETQGSKFFMRSTVTVLDVLVYLPAILMFARTWQGSRSKRTQTIALLTLLFQPALLLIDFGHFQYNSVMLGFALFALNFFATGQDLLGAFFFVLSLGFKQMALYYAPAIGSYLLAKCIYLGPTYGTALFVRLAVITSVTFLLLFLPFLPPFAPISGIFDPITRIFPFARGLFEDKVANFWCASNVLLKWKNWASSSLLVKLSTGLTALGFLPGVVGLLHSGFKHQLSEKAASESHAQNDERLKHAPFLPLLPYALLTSSMSFFLFSFQVHEKTILLPLLPITLLLSGAHVDSSVFSWGALVNNTAVFSMWPLLKRDGLGVQYIATLLLWNRLIGYNPFRNPEKSFVQLLSLAVYSAGIVLHILEFVIAPPSRYPDMYPVLNVLVSTPVFVLTWLWSIKCGIEVAWALGGLGPGSGSVKPVTERRMSVGADGKGSYRQMGGRAVSLGYSESRKRAAYGGSSRASSVVGGEDELTVLPSGRHML
ncbi:glucosyltransferase [Collybia nuda]|uniref:Alpha-1,3-glucosyltransferase n=1 Tax=Collybia nuda TaxID=64659 RepID=A0A9P5Y7A9_9AGAR|nr:glucosyltransferase [Collybia nuda]